MKNDGKNICRQLKEIRQQIAKDNNIPLEEHECQYEGPCNGTCPRCDAELKYLERELGIKQKLGKAALVAGVTLCLASACTQGDVYVEPGLEGDVYVPEDTTQCNNNERASNNIEAQNITLKETD